MLKRKHAETWTQWTAREDNLLRKLVAEGKTNSEIANILTHRTVSAIYSRKSVLGILQPCKFSPRDPHILAQVIKFKMAGWTHVEIAKVFNVDVSSVSYVLCQNGMCKFHWVRGKHKKPRQYWSETEVALLRKYLKKGLSFEQIYLKFWYRSQASIRSKIAKITRYWPTPAELAERERLRRKQLRVDWDQEPNSNYIR